jgi:hypothetical protein
MRASQSLKAPAARLSGLTKFLFRAFGHIDQRMHRLFMVSPLILTFAGCFDADCLNEIREEVISPDGKNKVVLFSRNCGATTGFNTQASILKQGEQLPDDGGNAFIIDQGVAKVSWKNNKSILVVSEHNARNFKQEVSVRGITFEYRKE